MQHIYGSFTYVEGMHAIQSSVAVVDRLPSPVRVSDPAKADSSNRNAETIHGYEGIALWIDSMRVNPDILRDSISEDSNERLVRMTFVRPKRSWDSITAIELRPANTLFVNGSQNTMFQDSWAIASSAGPKLRRVGPQEPLKTLEFFIPSDAPTFNAPMEVLTGRREIVSSMGNIIRRVKSHQHQEPVPASAELEEKVPQYLARRRDTRGTLVVFALVSPPGSMEMPGLDEPTRSSEETIPKADMSFLRLAFLKGSHLHRVTSGGGGWGKKQGLLSLDPAFDFRKYEDTGSLDAMLAAEGPDHRANSMNAVNSGDFVQFFASFTQETPTGQNSDLHITEDVNTSEWEGIRWMDSTLLHTIIGSLPSQDEFLMPPQEGKETESQIIGIPAHFGALSAGGTCLRRYKIAGMHTQPELDPNDAESNLAKLKQVAISRIDVPYGFWEAQSRNHPPNTKIRRIRTAEPSADQPIEPSCDQI
jgi:hypothetical protein